MTVSFEELCADVLNRCRKSLDVWASRPLEDCTDGFLDDLPALEVSQVSHEIVPCIDLQMAMAFLADRPELFDGEIGYYLQEAVRRHVVEAIVDEAEAYARSVGIRGLPHDYATPGL